MIENEDFLSTQLITYIGNKRALLGFIGKGVKIAGEKLSKKKLRVFDVFSGSGVVSRYFKQFSSRLFVNDIEPYAEILSKCYLSNISSIDFLELKEYYSELLRKLSSEPLRSGFITELYSPKDDTDIKMDERVFYTKRNAQYIDTARQYIDDVPESLRHFFKAPLLSEASIHANTSGVFKGFYKNSKTGIGQFGGNNGDAIFRIKGNIEIPFPIFSQFECELEIFRGDSNEIIYEVDEVDITYIDPPYNQHPYGSNYFMLNLINEYKKPTEISKVSGIPTDWNRSVYNRSDQAFQAFKLLVEDIKSKFLLISFNSEGFISREDMISMLQSLGKLTTLETIYNTFRGSRNLNGRDIHVKEYLYLVEKS